jgi:hypothetical protein
MSWVESFVITDAEDLSGTDFACWVSVTTLTITAMSYEYDKDLKTLTISNLGGGSTQLHLLKDIYFGDTSKPNNNIALCT